MFLLDIDITRKIFTTCHTCFAHCTSFFYGLNMFIEFYIHGIINTLFISILYVDFISEQEIDYRGHFTVDI